MALDVLDGLVFAGLLLSLLRADALRFLAAIVLIHMFGGDQGMIGYSCVSHASNRSCLDEELLLRCVSYEPC